MIIDLRDKQRLPVRRTYGKKALLFVVLLAALAANTAGLAAFEANVVNVVAEVVNDRVRVSPDSRQFCDNGPVEIGLATDAADALIIYTLDGSDPICGPDGQPVIGLPYAGPFMINETVTIKARACATGRQSAVMSWTFELAPEYCEGGGGGRVVINKALVEPDHRFLSGCYGNGEWIELYNPGPDPIDVSGWSILDGKKKDIFPAVSPLPPLGFALVTGNRQLFACYDIPPEAVLIALDDGRIGNGLDDEADMLLLMDADGKEIDRMNWGLPHLSWDNDPGGLWEPGLPLAFPGAMYARVPSGLDTDALADWRILSPPVVELTAPAYKQEWAVGETMEVRWDAENQNGGNDALRVNIYYSGDDGRSWALVEAGLPNTGAFDWAIPMYLDNGEYFVPSCQAKIKVTARGPENFLVQASDASTCRLAVKSDGFGQHCGRKD